MVNFEEELANLKAKNAEIEMDLSKVKEQVLKVSAQLDGTTDSILAKIQKSSVSWIIVLGYSFGVFTLGAVFF